MQSLKTVHSQSLQNTVFCLQQVLSPELLLQHGFNLLGGSLIIQMFCCVPESIEKTFYAIRWLVLKNFDTTFHGVSSMTLHTLAMVLRQSVVFSIGKFLFSDTNFVVASLKVFSIGVASA